MLNYSKLNQMVAQFEGFMSDANSLLEEFNTSPGTCSAGFNLANIFFSISMCKAQQEKFLFSCQG